MKIKNITTLHLKKSNGRSPLRLAFLLIPLVIVCFALLPTAQAVTPAPDGGYVNGNTAEGGFALNGLTTGVNNTALGFGALFHNTSGGSNSATGAGALFSNTTGNQNTANGVGALFSNTTIGLNSGHDNTATGFEALASNTTGSFNTANGESALFSNTDGGDNTAIGEGALATNATGNDNTAVGESALFSNTDGSGNIALGFEAGFNITTGDNNIDIGSGGLEGESNTIHIGSEAVQTATFVAGIRNRTTGNADAITVVIDSNGQIGTMSSSRRSKKEIKPMDQTSEAILALKPVTFHYKNDTKGRPQFGLIAEEVAKVNPDLVVRDAQGEIYTVRYEAVNAMLLNEFLKEQASITELKSTVAQQQKDVQATVAQQQKQIEALTAGLQKVTVQVQMNRSVPQTVADNH
jgi:hypothetical protein